MIDLTQKQNKSSESILNVRQINFGKKLGLDFAKDSIVIAHAKLLDLINQVFLGYRWKLLLKNKLTSQMRFSRKWRETDAIITCSCCNEEFADEQNYWVNKLRYTNTVDGLTYESGRYSLLCWY